jgi:hypothetical protein
MTLDKEKTSYFERNSNLNSEKHSKKLVDTMNSNKQTNVDNTNNPNESEKSINPDKLNYNSHRVQDSTSYQNENCRRKSSILKGNLDYSNKSYEEKRFSFI